ncbi:unnamed protein product [Candidula unifasciata]|uniref:Uncharacterized protein n=1 Tax=Candidula unifasciata TaxID=100452 RepID=A0A8S3ZEQ4_9EUPU|nr:unnamed protein product [Candidula unifasciata]
MTLGVIVTVCVAMGLVLSAVAVSPVTLRLFDGDSNWIHINFYEDDFLKFSVCMRTINSLSCTADLSRDAKHPNEVDDMKVLTVDKPEVLRISKAYSHVFSCNTSISKQQLVCRRLLADSNLCGTHVRTDYFRFVNESTPSSRCVGFRFSAIKESLLYDPISDGIEMCNISCNATGDTRHSSKPERHTSPRLPVEDGSTEATSRDSTEGLRHSSREPFHHHRDDDDDDKDKTHIIIAAVVSMVVTSGLIISGFLFRKHILGMRRNPNAQAEYVANNTTKDHTNNNINGHQEKTPPTSANSTDSSDLSLSTV